MNAVARTFVEAREDDIPGESAKVAYYFFLALFPLILTIFALSGLVGGDQVFNWLMGRIQAAVPAQTADFLGRFIRQITHDSRPGVLSIGLLLTVWSASAGVVALATSLNRLYGVGDSRSWWKRRAIALGTLVAMVFLLIGGALAILAGPELARSIGIPLDLAFLRWPLAFTLIVACLWIVYRVLPAREWPAPAGWLLLGALIGGILWIGVTLLFRLYVANFGSYSEVYGFVGAIIVLMLWLYLTAAAILFGAEVAAMLELRGEPGAAAPQPRESAA